MTIDTPYHPWGPEEWREVCSKIRSCEEPFYFDPWLDRITFQECLEPSGTLVLVVPNHLYQEFIEENLEPILIRTAQGLYGGHFSVSYRLGTDLAPLKRIEGHDCFKHPTNRTSRYFECAKCAVSWWRNAFCWEVLDMECSCGMRGWSEDTSAEWASDTECGDCYGERMQLS